MTICKFYLNGYCRYGSSCRFDHIDNRNKYSYVSDNYNQNSNRRQQQTEQQSTRNFGQSKGSMGFSFNRTLETINTNSDSLNRASNRTITQQINYNSRANSNTFSFSQTPTFSRTVFQSPISGTFSNRDNSRVGGFSFNRALQQATSNDNSSMAEDIDMDSSSVPRVRQNSVSRESQSREGTSFGFLSQQATSKSATKVDTVAPKVSSSHSVYSKESDLTENDRKQYESDVFVFKNIPIRPPTQQLCF